jgi:hypothetical protein
MRFGIDINIEWWGYGEGFSTVTIILQIVAQ